MRAKRSLPGLLAVGVAGALAMSGAVGASSAAACGATEFAGQGSSLQGIAQGVWKTGSGCKVTYTASGSAAGLEAFGVGEKIAPSASGDTYIGTDDAPSGSFTTGQLKEMEKEAAGTSTKPQDLVIPVAQGAIAIIDKPPTGCSLPKITNSDLQKVWTGEAPPAGITKWNEISTAVGGTACEHPIVRVVRQDGSGTTYQFKHYLFELNKGGLPGTVPANETWAQLQPETAQNLKWPVPGTVERPAAKGGGEEVKKVIATEDSIGYANLGDARAEFAKGARWIKVQNNGESATPTYADPSTNGLSETAASANCAGTSYGAFPSSILADQDWSQIYGGHPVATNYPICTLTWDVALMSYSQAGYANAATLGPVTEEYLRYVTSETEGQKEIENKHDYAELPKGVGSIQEVAAKLSILVNKP